MNPAYIGVVVIGLLHGLEPGHGWPVAVLYSARKKNPVVSATLSSGIIGLGHLVSSVAVVIAYVLLQRYLDFEAPWIKYIAAGVLVLLAVKLFFEKADDIKKQHGHLHDDLPEGTHEHEHEHDGSRHIHVHKHTVGVTLSLLGLAGFAFVLGFAHEEEFALLALVAGGADAWILMLSYSVAVVVGLVAITITGVKIYRTFRPHLLRYEKHVPRISAIVLMLLAVAILVF